MSNDYRAYVECNYNSIYHYGIKGTKWGVRRFQNEDGSLTPAGEQRYLVNNGRVKHNGKKKADKNSVEDNVKEAGKLMWKDRKKIVKDQVKDYAKEASLGAVTAGTAAVLHHKGVKQLLKDPAMAKYRKGYNDYKNAKMVFRGKVSPFRAYSLVKKHGLSKKGREAIMNEVGEGIGNTGKFIKNHLGSKEAVKSSAKSAAKFAKKHLGSTQGLKNTAKFIKRNKKAAALLGAGALVTAAGSTALKALKTYNKAGDYDMLNSYYQQAKQNNEKKRRSKRRS